jgi:FAD/FMN-containing dehydrogenase
MAAAEDFGRLVHRLPEGVLLPASAEDVAATVRWAAAAGRGFAAQGNRHSVFGRAQVRDGIVADMRRLRVVHDLRDDRVVADAGVTWRELLAATLPRGLVPPCFPTTSTCRSAAPWPSAASAAGPGDPGW